MRHRLAVEAADGVYVALAPADGILSALTSDQAYYARTGVAGGDITLGSAARRRRESVAARALLRRLLAEVAGVAAGAAPIAARPGGQPYLPARPDLAISLSHSGPWVAAAVGIGPEVGVDVQVPQPAPETLLRRCCGPAARQALAAMPPDQRDLEFAWIWTAQEACVKATGSGLAGRPWTVPVDVDQHTGTWNEVRWLALRDRYGTPVSCAYRPRHGEVA